MPGLLFHHVTPAKDYMHNLMKPWIHYIPVAPDLRDLKEKYEWAESHPRASKLIADSGSDLVRRISTPEGFADMYNEVFLKPVSRVLLAYQPVSTTHPGRKWREVLNDLSDNDMKLIWRCSGGAPINCFREDQD